MQLGVYGVPSRTRLVLDELLKMCVKVRQPMEIRIEGSSYSMLHCIPWL